MKNPVEAFGLSLQVASNHILLLPADGSLPTQAEIEPMDTHFHAHNPYHGRNLVSEIPASICQHCEAPLTGSTSVPYSPIPYLLGTNSIPTEEQSQWIRGILDVAMVDVQRLEGEILRVKSVLGQLQGESYALNKFVDTHRAFLTPARRVYPDIWAEIFKYCPRGSTHRRFTDVEDSFDPKEGPLVLTQVCSAWRQIAISTPQLWNTIRVTIKCNNTSQLALARTWIQRSGGLPLTVAIIEGKITSHSREYPSLDWSDEAIFHELCASSRRWKDLYLMLPASHLPWSALRAIHHELPSLQKLAVHTSRGTVPPDLVVDLFEDAPLLQWVSLDYTTSFSMLSVQLDQITRLEFNLHKHTPASIDSCLLSLDVVPNAEECIFHVGACEPWTILPAVHHSQLRALKIIAEPLRDNTQKGLARFFSNLSVPNLKSLVVHSFANERQWDHYAIGHFLSRTPVLENLELKCDNIKPNELLEELREATTLSSLTLSVPTRPTEELLDYLSSTDTVNLLPFLVQLKSISFEALAKPDFIFRIGRMIACRTMLANVKRTAELMFVKYDFPSSPSPKFDCTGHEADSRENHYIVTRRSASFIFRRRSAQLAHLPLQPPV